MTVTSDRRNDAVSYEELLGRSAIELLAGYQSGEFSPREVAAAALARAERLQDPLNAFATIDSEGALAAAGASEDRWHRGSPKGRLDGVPATTKDLMRTKGWVNRYGSHTTGLTPEVQDAPASARLREHGAVLIGATTTPEFGWKGVTDSPLTGITRNPWNSEMTPGGSSGGAAVAAATGIAPLNIGTDGGGSIRIPAAFTGIFGLKPSFARVPAYPASPFGTVAHVGPMTMTVPDAALTLTVISEPDPRDWHPLPTDRTDYGQGLDETLEGLRIAYSPSLGGHHVDAEVRDLVLAAARRLEVLGARVEEQDPPIPKDLAPDFARHWYVGAANLMRRIPQDAWKRMDPGLVEIAAEGRSYSLLEFLAAGDRRRDMQLAMSLFHEEWDLLLTPAMPIAAFEAGLEVPAGSGQGRWTEWTPFSYPFNLSGQPAASVPCGLTGKGLPVAFQLVGPLYSDALVLRAAAAYEKAVGGFSSPPETDGLGQ